MMFLTVLVALCVLSVALGNLDFSFLRQSEEDITQEFLTNFKAMHETTLAENSVRARIATTPGPTEHISTGFFLNSTFDGPGCRGKGEL